MDEEELVNLKEQEKDVEILHNINPNMCELSIHALISLSTPQTFNIA